jgi:hypothetical protein
MESYRELARQRYNQQKEKEKIETELLLKKEEEERKRKEEEERLLREEEERKRLFFERQFNLLNSSVEYDKSVSDDELLFNLTCIIQVLEILISKIDQEQRNYINDVITKFIFKIDSINKKRDIKVAKMLSTYFKEICRILDLTIEIDAVDTSLDEQVAAELAHNFQKPKYLNDATEAAIKRQLKTKKDKDEDEEKPKKLVKKTTAKIKA